MLSRKKLQRNTRVNFESLEPRRLLSTTVQIPGTSDPWIEAGLTAADAGTAPISVALGTGTGRVVTFTSVTGQVQGNTTTSVFAGPDGFTTSQGTQNLMSVGGISGFVQHSEAGDFALIGVFTADTVPKSGAPIRLQYNGPTPNVHFSPLIDQVFFVGDGRAGTSSSGAIQQFNVPAGATHLFLGFPDGPLNGKPGRYNDNGGALSATVNVSNTAPSTFVVSGSVVKDVNAAPGPGLSNWRVYVDAGNDGRFDPADPSALTDSSGNFTMNLKPGTYTLAVEIQNGFAIASPSTFTFSVTVSSSPVTGLQFVLKPVTATL